VSPAGAELAAELALADAAALARRGEYDAALRVLEESTVDSPELWDLKARINAQHGDLPAADAAWQRVLAADPDNAAALAGRKLIGQIQRGRRRRRPVPVLAIGVVVLVLLAGGAVATAVATGTGGHPVPVAAHGDQALRRRVDSLESRNARRRAADRQTRQRLADLADALRGNGVRIMQRQHDVQVVFTAGLFPPDGSGLTTAGRQTLASWGPKLANQRVTVTVLGHEALLAGEPAEGGSVLEISRAEAAAAALSTASGLPLSAFTVSGAEQSAAPYPGQDPTSQSRDRTVTLLATPA
jgi:tetratricopeptide (TPR) repeat protein